MTDAVSYCHTCGNGVGCHNGICHLIVNSRLLIKCIQKIKRKKQKCKGEHTISLLHQYKVTIYFKFLRANKFLTKAVQYGD